MRARSDAFFHLKEPGFSVPGQMENRELFLEVIFLVACFGVVCSVFYLFVLYFTRKQRHVEGYGPALAQNCSIDLVFVGICAVAKFDNKSTRGFFMYAITRFDYAVDPLLIKALLVAMVCSACLCMYVIGIPFYIRYLVVCKRQSIALSTRLLLYGVALGYGLVTTFFVVEAFEVFPPELEGFRMRPVNYPNRTGRYWNIVAARVDEYPFICMMTSICLGLSLSYVCAIVFNVKVLRYLQHYMDVELQTKYRNLQLTMTVQTLAQTLTLFIPMGCLTLSAFLQYEDSIIFCALIECAPAITTISTMLSVPEYREKFRNSIDNVIYTFF